MGSSSSKFRKALQNGEEIQAMQLYMANSELRKKLDPNLSYGSAYDHNTALHFASKYAMKSMLKLFLSELNGNPNKKNLYDETSLHWVCLRPAGTLIESSQSRNNRKECLLMMLNWQGALLKSGEKEKADLKAVDQKGNTPLHYAALNGFSHIVQLLVVHQSFLFAENKDGQTPCDCAEKASHQDIANFLESKMVFYNTGESASIENISLFVSEEGFSGLRPQDLQEAKDQLVVETADMLCVPLFTAEALLRNHEWSREGLIDSWMRDPIACCERSGVEPPSNTCNLEHSQSTLLSIKEQAGPALPLQQSGGDSIICDICSEAISNSEEPVDMPCSHQFCRVCWRSYLTGKIQEGAAHNLLCPAYNCSKLVPIETIENLVSRETALRYLQFDIKAFVESNPNLKWCPAPGCGRAVKLPLSEAEARLSRGGGFGGRGSAAAAAFPEGASAYSVPVSSTAVNCGNGHTFCWDCLGEAHEPCSCDDWAKWQEKVKIKPEDLSKTNSECESAANCLWLVTNSKPCPKCNSPIQKNEGCNHMKCTKCKHDFCWVCLEPWSKHGSSTGGYFRCNRYEVVQKVENKSDVLLKEAEEKNSKMQEMNRFVHYYTRFKNHENSHHLEEPLRQRARGKIFKLMEASNQPGPGQSSGGVDADTQMQFIEEAISELLKARKILKYSYAYGFYLEEERSKAIFEFMQNELEEATETLSETMNRPHLRVPKSKIIQMAVLVMRKRQEFLAAVSKGLIPPETPPEVRKKQMSARKLFGISADEDSKALHEAIEASLKSKGSDGWVKDSSGRHNNIKVLYNYLGYDPDSSVAGNFFGPPEDADTGEAGSCLRPHCGRPRARNTLGRMMDHCSLECMRRDHQNMVSLEGRYDGLEESATNIDSEHINLLRALEMSMLSTSEADDQAATPATPSRDTPPRDSDDSDSDEGGGGVQPSRRWRHQFRHSKSRKVSSEEIEDELELQQALEMSLKGVDPTDTDLRMAIEQSLRESQGIVGGSGGAQGSGEDQGHQLDQLDMASVCPTNQTLMGIYGIDEQNMTQLQGLTAKDLFGQDQEETGEGLPDEESPLLLPPAASQQRSRSLGLLPEEVKRERSRVARSSSLPKERLWAGDDGKGSRMGHRLAGKSCSLPLAAGDLMRGVLISAVRGDWSGHRKRSAAAPTPQEDRKEPGEDIWEKRTTVSSSASPSPEGGDSKGAVAQSPPPDLAEGEGEGAAASPDITRTNNAAGQRSEQGSGSDPEVVLASIEDEISYV